MRNDQRTIGSDCEQFIQAGERFEKKLYLFALLQLGNQAAASLILKKTFVLCYRADAKRIHEKAFALEAFKTCFVLCAKASFSGSVSGGVARQAPPHRRGPRRA